jgi:phosphopantothenoylcysteine synthetase/decarboxylase
MKQQQQPEQRGTLYHIICASASTPLAYKLIQEAQRVGWNVYAVLTPLAQNVVDSRLLAQLTGHQVYSEPLPADAPAHLPSADAILVFPATITLLQAWACGTSETFAVALLSASTKRQIPIVAVPCWKIGDELTTNPAFLSSVHRLTQAGIDVLYNPHPSPPKKQISPQSILERLHRPPTKKPS